MPIPDDQRPEAKSPLAFKYKFLLALAALASGVYLLVHGGQTGDTMSQTAGGSIIAAVLGVLGYTRFGGKS